MGDDAPALSLGSLLWLAGVALHSRLIPLTKSMLQRLLPCACSTPLQQVHGLSDCSAQSLWVLGSATCHPMPSQAGRHKLSRLSQKAFCPFVTFWKPLTSFPVVLAKGMSELCLFSAMGAAVQRALVGPGHLPQDRASTAACGVWMPHG